MQTLFRAFVLTIAVFAADTALACLPCPETWTLEQTVEKADVIVVAKALAASARTNKEARDISTEIRVESVLKGSLEEAELTISSWHGMCPSGLFLEDDERAVIYLHKDKGRYYVSDCGPKKHSLQGDVVALGAQSLSIEAFKAIYLPQQ